MERTKAMNYKLGSLFDGSGGFPLAGTLCGIEPVWAAEVEPYPIAVTRERFPEMKHLGDIRQVNGADIEPVDIITFGSPCQDLSVAGKRAGLKHEANGDEETTRSGLFMDAVRIIKEMRKATNGMYPRFVIWENVPGAFSSNKGEDFRIVCEELIKIVEPTASMPAVPENGWAYADSYIGDGWSLAYRVFDAQYWGVPQRRRRIHLVADFRGTSAREVLFERQGVRGYFTQGTTPWQAAPGNAADRTGTASLCLNGHGGIAVVEPIAYDARGNGDGKTVNTLTGDHENRVTDYTSVVVYDGLNVTSPINASNPKPGDPCHTLSTGGRSYVVYESHPQDSRVKEDKSYTLNTIDRPAVAYRQGGYSDYVENEVGTIKACGGNLGGGSYTGQDAFSEMLVTSPQCIVRRLTPTECARLQGFSDDWGHPEHKEDFTDDEYRFWLDVRNTYAAINGKPQKGYTKEQMLTWYNKLHTDSSEYKMWGNGIALPPALYCMQGITDVLNAKED